MTMTNIENLFYDALSDANYLAAIDIVLQNNLLDELHFDDKTYFQQLYQKFYKEEVWNDGAEPNLKKIISDNIHRIRVCNFDLPNLKYSFFGSLFHTSLEIEAIHELFDKGAKPNGISTNIYLGSIVPILDPIVTKKKKIWGTNFLVSNLEPSEKDTLSVEFGKAIPDSFVASQQRCLWSWRRDEESIAIFGDISRYKEKFVFDVELVMDHGAKIDQRSDEEDHTGTMRAAMNWMPEALDFLLSKGADVNIQSGLGNTALMYVSGYLPDTSPMNEKWEELPEHLQIAKILVEAGADISIKNKSGDTAIDLARKNKNTAVLEYLESL